MEFAVVAVLFFFVLYGIIAYGMAIALRQSMGQAAGEAVRAAIVFPGSNEVRILEALKIADEVTGTLGKDDPLLDVAPAQCPPDPVNPNPPDCKVATYGYSTIEASIDACTTGSGTCISLSYSYDYRDEGAIVPGGPFGVALPNDLTATAVGQIVP